MVFGASDGRQRSVATVASTARPCPCMGGRVSPRVLVHASACAPTSVHTGWLTAPADAVTGWRTG